MKKVIIGIILVILLLGGGTFFYLYQFTEIIERKIVPIKLDKVVINYVPGYSLDEASLLNIDKEKEPIKIQKIKLTKEEKKEISKYFRKLTKKEKQTKKDNQKLYEININDTVLDIYNKDGLVTRNKKKTPVKISNEFYDHLELLIEKYQKELLKEYKFEEITYSYNKSTINIKNNLELFEDQLVFYPIELEEDYKKYNNGYEMVLTIDKKLHIYLYNNKIDYVVDQREETEDNYYAICVNNLYEILTKIYEKSTAE